MPAVEGIGKKQPVVAFSDPPKTATPAANSQSVFLPTTSTPEVPGSIIAPITTSTLPDLTTPTVASAPTTLVAPSDSTACDDADTSPVPASHASKPAKVTFANALFGSHSVASDAENSTGRIPPDSTSSGVTITPNLSGVNVSHSNPALTSYPAAPQATAAPSGVVPINSASSNCLPLPFELVIGLTQLTNTEKERVLTRLILKTLRHGGDDIGIPRCGKFEKYSFVTGYFLASRGLPINCTPEDKNDVFRRLLFFFLDDPRRFSEAERTVRQVQECAYVQKASRHLCRHGAELCKHVHIDYFC